MIRVGIVGLGFMGATHIKAYQKVSRAKIVALCNPSGRHLDGDFSSIAGNVGDRTPLRLDMNGIAAYQDVGSFLADPGIDLVDICVPTAAHHSLAIPALRAGKHVICEKPLARTSAQAKEIVDAAQNAKGFFMPAMCLRFWPEWKWLQTVISEQRFGRVLSARFRRVTEPPGWGQTNFFNGQLSGGALFDLHIHDTDFVQFCFGTPAAVFSTGQTHLSGAVDHIVTQYLYDSVMVIHAEGGWCMTPGFGFSMSYTVNFERGTADYDINRGTTPLRVVSASSQEIACEGPDGYIAELQYMVDCVESGKSPDIVTALDGLNAVKLCEAEEESVRSRRIVPVAG